MIANLNSIDQQMMLKQKILPTIIDDMCRQKDFDANLGRVRSYRESTYSTEVLQKIEVLFEYSKEWAKANLEVETGLSVGQDFYARLKRELEPCIKEVIHALFNAIFQLEKNRFLKISSFKICKGLKLGKNSELVVDISGKSNIIYENLEHFEASKEHFIEDLDGSNNPNNANESDGSENFDDESPENSDE